MIDKLIVCSHHNLNIDFIILLTEEEKETVSDEETKLPIHGEISLLLLLKYFRVYYQMLTPYNLTRTHVLQKN